MKRIFLPLTEGTIRKLKAGDEIELWGTLYTARDRAHQRLTETLKKRKRPPIALAGQVIYYTGPTAKRPGWAIGSCGPTTSSRMDAFTPLLLSKGVKAMIGKGDRSPEVIKAIKKQGAVYLVTPGGIGALLCQKVHTAQIVAYKDLGPEAIYKLQVRAFPVTVAIDWRGNSIFRRYGERRRKK